MFVVQMLIEYCDGGALDSIMAELDKPLTEPQIAFVCQQMCQGLSFLHRSRIIHRDLKAGNVLLTMQGGVKLGIMSFSKQLNVHVNVARCYLFHMCSYNINIF